MSNRLARAASLYLRQHAENPVDWYEWGPAAFAAARERDKPIFLSVGYSACHWCHVMAHESFEDPALAEQLNAEFVAIKVDREERPDVDSIYMNAVVAISGQGGWPMSVFLTPEGEPFFGGTYFPPQPRYGMPSFSIVLEQISHAWSERRAEVDESAQKLIDRLAQFEQIGGSDLPSDLLARAAAAAAEGFDFENGGWGDSPKFPMAMTIDFLLGHHAQSGVEGSLKTACRSLDCMAAGGIFDHLRGGFHRYSVDSVWLVPHFEKMLYDNAQLANCYLHAWQVCEHPRYLETLKATLDYVLAEMTGPDGWFYAAQDADSEGVEGKYYVWDLDEIEALLGDDAKAFCRYYDVTLGGNFEGRNILHEPTPEGIAAALGRGEDGELDRLLRRSRSVLLAARAKRIAPATDKKAVTSWNALMLASFAEAGAVLGDPGYLGAAQRNARFLLEQLRSPAGLSHSWAIGRASGIGFLEDYAALADALLTLYESDFDKGWYDVALELATEMIELFATDDGTLSDTRSDQTDLIIRPRRREDNATPSGAALAVRVMLRIWSFTADEKWRERAIAAIPGLGDTFIRHGTAFSKWLQALGWLEPSSQQVAIVGDPEGSRTKELVATVRANWRADRVLAVGRDPEIPLLSGRSRVEGMPTAYVCHKFVCQQPTTDPDSLSALLGN